MTPSRIAIALLAVASLAVDAAAGESGATAAAAWYRGKLTTTAGFSYTEGDYGGSADTEVWYVPFSVKYSFRELGLTRRDRIDFKLALPYLRLTGPEGARFDLAGEVLPGSGEVRTHDGLGDVSISAKYVYVPVAEGRPVRGFETKLKVPTGDASQGLGSGTVDMSFSGEVSRTFELPRHFLLTPFAEVGYRWREDRRDQFRASAGLSAHPFERLDVGLSYQFASRASAGSTDRHELSPFAVLRISDAFSVEPFGVFGLSQSSLDFGAGLTLRVSIQIAD